MALNYILVFDDTVVKLSINLGLENQRDSKTLGSFTVGELAFTRDSGRVFVGDFTDDNHPNHLETVGGILVGNKYLGSIDSKSLESFNSDFANEVKSLNFTTSTSADPLSRLLGESEKGIIFPGSKFKIESNNFTFDYENPDSTPLTEENWSRWNRHNSYSDKYDAYNGDYIYDKFQNALVVFDDTIKETTDEDKVVRAGWLHNDYGPSFNVWVAKNEVPNLKEYSSLADIRNKDNYKNVTKVYPFITNDTESNKWYACKPNGELLSDGSNLRIEVLRFDAIASSSLVSFFKLTEDKTSTSRNTTSIDRWNGLWVIDNTNEQVNDGLLKVKASSTNDTEMTISSGNNSNLKVVHKMAIYLDEDGLPFENQTESTRRTILKNRDSLHTTYGDGYVLFRNIEPDGKYITFKKRKGYVPRIGNDDNGKLAIQFDELESTNSNVITISTLPVDTLYANFNRNDFNLNVIEGESSIRLLKNLNIQSINSENRLKLPSSITFSSSLNGSARGSELTTGLNITFDYYSLVDTDSHTFSMVRDEINGGYIARVTPYSQLPVIVHLGDGLIGENGNKEIKCYVMNNNATEAITLEDNASGIINEEYGLLMVYDGLYTHDPDDEDNNVTQEYTYDGLVYYIGSLVVNDKGLVFDSDKFYNGDNLQISESYREHNTPINFLKNPKPILWTYDNSNENLDFLVKFAVSDSKVFCSLKLSSKESTTKPDGCVFGLGYNEDETRDYYYPLLRGRLIQEKGQGDTPPKSLLEIDLDELYIEVYPLLKLDVTSEVKVVNNEELSYDISVRFGEGDPNVKNVAKAKDVNITYNDLIFQHVKSIRLKGINNQGAEFEHVIFDNAFSSTIEIDKVNTGSHHREQKSYSFSFTTLCAIEKFKDIIEREGQTVNQEDKVTLYDLEFMCGDNCNIRGVRLNDINVVSHIIIETFSVDSSLKIDDVSHEKYYKIQGDVQTETIEFNLTLSRFGVKTRTNTTNRKPDNGYLYYELTKEALIEDKDKVIDEYPDFNMVAKGDDVDYLVFLDECEEIEKKYVKGVQINDDSLETSYERHTFEVLDTKEELHTCMKLNLVSDKTKALSLVVWGNYSIIDTNNDSDEDDQSSGDQSESDGNTKNKISYRCDPLIWFKSGSSLLVVNPEAEEANAFVNIPEHARSVILSVDAKFSDDSSKTVLSTAKDIDENRFNESITRSLSKKLYSYENGIGNYIPPVLLNEENVSEAVTDIRNDEAILMSMSHNSIRVIEVPINIDIYGNKYFVLIGRDIPIGNSSSSDEKQREFVVNYIGYRV